MSREYLKTLDAPRQEAVTQLTDLVRQHYPDATFTVAPGEEDPAITHILAMVDVDDPDEVTDLTIERELAFLEQGMAVYVIPLRTPEREAALQRSMKEKQRGITLPPPVSA